MNLSVQNGENGELLRWRQAFAGEDYFYGDDAGPVARRAVRYHRPLFSEGATALDAGCGEGQDVAFLAASGYHASGVEFTPEGLAKTRRLLQSRGLKAQLISADLRRWTPPQPYDLVLCVNALQFLGPNAPEALHKLMEAVAPGGVLGLSAFARELAEPALQETVFRWTPEEIMSIFGAWQPLEAARVWQWREDGSTQPFVTLIARRPL